MSTRPRPITVENSWLNKSLEDRIQILRTVAPLRADGLELLLNEALKDEWKTMGGAKGPKGDGVDR